MITRATIDFIFRFDNEPLNVAELVRTGDNTYYYCLIDGNRQPSCWEVPAGTVAEIEGVEIYLTPDGTGEVDVYNPLEYVRLEVNETELENITFNELMAPFHPAGGMTTGVPPFRDASTCINIGKAILAGGASSSTSIKLTQHDKLRIAVKSPRAVRGGTIINRALFVRVHACTGTEDDVATKWPDGFIDQSLSKLQKRVPATIDTWTQCHGGREAKPPYVERYITYAKNNSDTVPHSKHYLSRRTKTVDEQWMSLDWEVKDGEMVLISHVGVAEDETNDYHNHPNLAYIGIPHYPEEMLVFPASPYQRLSKYPMPLNRTLDPVVGGPGELSIPVVLNNENAAITIRDNGTAITGWTQTEVGAAVAVWGYKYKLY
ncbi:MAG: hypothetical protein M0R06_00705 [Sphaerochaeta sp.]|jgi:hypothetical protein|nr:hypothetical protein [Sphaerochaeta sp.]